MLVWRIRVLVPSIRGGSGITTYTLALAAGLAAAGHDVVVLDETGECEPPHPRVTIAPLRSPLRLRGPLEPLAEWSRVRDVGRLAREFEVDGVHVTRLGLIPGAERFVITAWDPIFSPVGRFRAARQRGEGPAREAAYGVLDAVASLRSSAIVAVTQAVRESLHRFEHCEFIPPSLADDAIAPAIASRPHDVVLVAGILDMERKGLDLALTAMPLVRRQLPDARLILIGGWEDAARRGALPEFCEVRGSLSRAEVGASFAAAGCCLVPSLWEEFGYAGLEALAAGIPLACTPLPGYQGLSGGGIFAAGSRNPEELAAKLVAALGASEFEFPPECRNSVAVPRILSLYESAFGSA